MITVLTPTYNRGYCLKNLYDSLIRQTERAFEWIVIDDGSTDDTEELVKGWMKITTGFSIKYYKQENGGKHRALNRGISVACGDYVFIVDSDDYLSNDSIEKVSKWVLEIESDGKFAGVSGTRANKNTKKLIGDFPNNVNFIDASNLQRRRMHLLGDKAEIYKKSILMKYPFPEFSGERFIGESVVWDEIAHDGYKIRWHRDVIYYGEYQDDGLTRNCYDLFKQNPEGYALVKRKSFKYESFPSKWGALSAYIDFAKKQGMTIDMIRKKMEITKRDLLIGICMYYVWKIKKILSVKFIMRKKR